MNSKEREREREDTASPKRPEFPSKLEKEMQEQEDQLQA
jgi:hypothetical protein